MNLDGLNKIILHTFYCEVEIGEEFQKDGKVTVWQISYFQHPTLLEHLQNLIKEILNTNSQEIYKALSFEDYCTRCGECCRRIPTIRVTSLEAKTIANYLNMDVKEFLKQYTEPSFSWDSQSFVLGRKDLNKKLLNTCIFLEEGPDGLAGCKIHSTRPKACKDYQPNNSTLCKIGPEHIRNILELHLFLERLELITVLSKKNTVPNPILNYEFHPKITRHVQSIIEELKNIDTPEEIVFAEQSGVECARCGWCCFFRGEVLVTNDDIAGLSEFLKITPQEFTEKYTRRVITWDKEARVLNRVSDPFSAVSNGCIFIKQGEDKLFHCSVYSARPQACKDYKPSAYYCGPRQGWSSL